MPTTVESLLIVVVLIAPGFIANQVRSSLVPYRVPSALQETIRAIVLSAVMIPAWLAFTPSLLRSRDQFLLLWRESSSLPWWAVAIPLGVMVVVYFLVAPAVGVLDAVLQVTRPHARMAHWLLRKIGVTTRYEAGPEVWDQVFGHRETQPWVRIWFKNGMAIEGVIKHAGTSPATKQLYLTGLKGVPNSLVRLDAEGTVIEDLSAKEGDGIWVEIGSEVFMVEIF